MMDRLLREGNPPAGQLASPKPQYKDVQTNNWEELKGEGGASYVKDKDVFAKLEQVRELLVQLSGNIPVYNTVLVNAASVPAGEFTTGEIALAANPWIDKILILVNIDKQPWSLYTISSVGAFWSPYCFYPLRDNVAKSYPSMSRPATSVLLPIPLGSDEWGLANEAPKSFAEAFSLALRPSERRVRVFNNSQEVATVTIRAVYIGR